MFIQLNVFDTADKFRGQARIKLDWQRKMWTVDEDHQWIWKRVGYSDSGAFEFKSWGVIWIWDQLRNTVIFHDAPQNEIDFKHRSGHGRIFDPRDNVFKDGKISWSIDATANAAAQQQVVPASDIRTKLIKRLRELLPCKLGGTPKEQKDWDTITSYLTKVAGTSCGSLPQFVSAYLGAEPLKNGKPSGNAAYAEYMKKRSLSGTKAIRDRGNQFGAWIEADLIKRPKMGDIYGLLDRDKNGQPLTDKKNDYIGHVGVILDASGPVWTTADLGQGNGWEGKIDVVRPYKADIGQLYGEVRQGGVSPYRVLAGWVDIDKYFAK
jgi:hypothetical protein